MGEYEAPIALTHEHIVNVKVWVVQDAREAAEMAAERAEAEARGELEPVAEGSEPEGDVSDTPAEG